MLKTPVALMLTAAVVKTAYAQSSVTLYGLLDEGLTYTSNAGGHSAWQLTGGYPNGNRWGLRGTEDLGGGLSAQFVVESGFQISNGAFQQGGRMFGRQAFVGLSSSHYGTLTLGRQYDPLVSYADIYTAASGWGGLLFTHPYDNDTTNDFFRVNNSVKYASPNIGGLQFGGMYAFSNSTGFADNRLWAVAVNYARGPYSFGLGYMSMNGPGTSCSGAVAGGTATTCGVGGDVTFTADKHRVFVTGAGYTVGKVNISVSYANSQVKGATTPISFASDSIRFNNIDFNVRYQLTTALMVAAMYEYTNFTQRSDASEKSGHWNLIGLQVDYFLSKRTDVYMQGLYERGSSVVANISGSVAAATGGTQSVCRVGLRHKF